MAGSRSSDGADDMRWIPQIGLAPATAILPRIGDGTKHQAAIVPRPAAFAVVRVGELIPGPASVFHKLLRHNEIHPSPVPRLDSGLVGT